MIIGMTSCIQQRVNSGMNICEFFVFFVFFYRMIQKIDTKNRYKKSIQTQKIQKNFSN